MNTKKIIVTVTLLSLLSFPVTLLGETEDYPLEVDLIAGQNIDAGDVSVWDDGENLYVKYVTEDGWCLTETHLHVADVLEDIPQTPLNKNGKGKVKGGGNPIPGQFDYKMEHDCVSEYIIEGIPLASVSGDEIAIAAHAVVIQKTQECMNVVSDAEVDWSADGSEWADAVACWDHPSWNDVSGATWVWKTYYTDIPGEYNNVPEGGWYFRKEFEILGNPVSGEIEINVDNSYALSLNGVSIGGEGSMDKDGPDNQEWSTIDTFSLTNLTSGINTIEVRALNFFNSGSSTSNPAGLAFNAEVCYAGEEIIARESAWAGDLEFSEKNWSMYFTYSISEI